MFSILTTRRLFLFLFFLAAILFFPAVDADAASKCRYCGLSGYGSCAKSPYKVHEHVGDEKKCEFCGLSGYGRCSKSPFRNHRHGHGGDKCIWCGLKGTGSCSHSPHGKHEK